MKIILEYIYVGSIEVNSLTKDNIIEAYCAADYFQLLDLQEFIMRTIKIFLKNNYTTNYSPELLSKVVEIMPLSEDNTLLNLLVKEVATILLTDIEIGRLSIIALQYLLFYAHENDIPFATPEYEVFRYSAIFAAKNVSDVTYKALMEKLPTLEQIDNLIQIENKFITDHQKVAQELEHLIEYIDFRRIKKSQFDFIEPLKIIPAEIIQHNSELINSDLNNIRGIPIYRIKESELFWDESACGSNLVIEDNGKIIQASNNCKSHQSARANILIEDKGNQPNGWVLGSGGAFRNNNNFMQISSELRKVEISVDRERSVEQSLLRDKDELLAKRDIGYWTENRLRGIFVKLPLLSLEEALSCIPRFPPPLTYSPKCTTSKTTTKVNVKRKHVLEDINGRTFPEFYQTDEKARMVIQQIYNYMGYELRYGILAAYDNHWFLRREYTELWISKTLPPHMLI
ncbi:hypothetical protein GLOIN_2v810459 [Rhizophagus irregularis DAOM 181602=DAOM 197198]|nr:hypothetical protein GLOIN_2v810459 [Rhizophagus irregularis DAOM 181602=DAOM 197198]